LTGPSDIAHWRLQIFHRLLLVILLLGGATAVPSVLLAASEGLWLVAVIDTVAMLWLLLIWYWRTLGFDLRVSSFLAVTFAVGAALMVQDRPVSQIYLAAVPVLAALNDMVLIARAVGTPDARSRSSSPTTPSCAAPATRARCSAAACACSRAAPTRRWRAWSTP
jgi:hypothetical protein